jgi:hypothetical protein
LEPKTFKESISDVLWIVKSCLTTLWFWVPILFGVYIIIQLWMFFFLSPLSLFIVPGLICIYALKEEDKRTKAQYNLPKTKLLRASHPLGSGPVQMSNHNIEQSVEEYLRILEKENS